MSFPINGTSAPNVFIAPVDGGTFPVNPPKTEDTGFADLIGQAINKVNESQAVADTSVKQFMTGEQTEIHSVMLAMERARLSMMMAVEVRNKMVESYQEISRMPL
jgi:flagellar hook-basal body complex protein FliE